MAECVICVLFLRAYKNKVDYVGLIVFSPEAVNHFCFIWLKKNYKNPRESPYDLSSLLSFL